MRRREFTSLLGGAVATWPTFAFAQRVRSPIEGAIRHACNSKTS
jgi:hypothetical protein